MAKCYTALGRDIFLYRDSCNVYLMRDDEYTVAIDFGTDTWLNHLDDLGIADVDQVVPTRGRHSDFVVHAPAGERDSLTSGLLDNF